MSEVLEPRLTRLDERVLEAVPRERGDRLWQLLMRVHGRDDRLAYGTLESRARRRAVLSEELRGILRGLEHRGLVSGRGGWWRRTDGG